MKSTFITVHEAVTYSDDRGKQVEPVILNLRHIISIKSYKAQYDSRIRSEVVVIGAMARTYLVTDPFEIIERKIQVSEAIQ